MKKTYEKPRILETVPIEQILVGEEIQNPEWRNWSNWPNWSNWSNTGSVSQLGMGIPEGGEGE